MTLVLEAISNSLKEQTLIPDALENLAKSTVRNRQKVEQTILPLKKILSTMSKLSRQDLAKLRWLIIRLN